jgi:hypothetical protein
MSSFFDSDIIQYELKEINKLQEKIYGSILTFGMMDRETKLEHIEKLELLLEKQRVMYTRLSLSDDPKAVEMKENLRKSVALMGFPPETDMQVLFTSMTKTIESLKKYPESKLSEVSKWHLPILKNNPNLVLSPKNW